jgi:hypothetical protein
VLLLSYSRSGMIAAATGGLAALLLGLAAARARAVALAGAVAVAALVAAGAYSPVEALRRDVSYPRPDAAYRFVDLSGWDGRAQGLIPRGPAAFANSGADAIHVTPSDSGQGVSFAWGRAEPTARYELTFEARVTRGREVLAFGMEDNVHGNAPGQTTATLTPRWERFTQTWRPSEPSADARLYVWEASGRTPFELRDVRVDALAGGTRATVTEVPARLRGSEYDRIVAGYRREEQRGEQSRREAIELGVRAFRSEPIRGIGWERFPDYAERNAAFGRLASHNDYARVAAELGVPGVLALLGLLVTVLLQITRVGRSRAAQGAAGVAVTAAVGLSFLNGLVAPAVSIPFAIAAAVLCAALPSRAR